MTSDDLNTCDRETFVAALGWIFEDSPWVAGRAFDARPFAGLTDLHRAMCAIVESATHDEQLAILRAHPDLGTKLSMSRASVREQSGAGLTGLDEPELRRLQDLNLRYRERFGFPFLFAVKGSTPAEILAALGTRVERSATQEFTEALEQMYRIAKFRLDEAISEDRTES